MFLAFLVFFFCGSSSSSLHLILNKEIEQGKVEETINREEKLYALNTFACMENDKRPQQGVEGGFMH